MSQTTLNVIQRVFSCDHMIDTDNAIQPSINVMFEEQMLQTQKDKDIT